jgi:acetaldehyde dehydrogenase/alcohol dehydrogenase
MQVRPEFTAFGVTDPNRLDPYLDRRRFAQGQCLMRQGTAGGECYLIEDGEVRLEVERPDLDSHGVIAYLHAGMLCGEFSFLDGRPRSASAYTHTDVVASRLSAERLQQLCGNDPQTGLAVLRALGQDAAAKARQSSQQLEEFVFTEQIDPSADRMVAAAAAAQAALAGWPEARVEALLEQIAQAAAVRAEELAAATVTETGIGNVADKTFKNRFASLEVNRSLQGKPGVGRWPTDERGVTEIASPVGVVLGLIPMTNPVSTLVFKTLICLKARNALIVSHHPAAVGIGVRTVELIRAVLRDQGALVDLLQSVERASRTRTAMFMRHPGVSLILATGGAAMVKAAYSSGTPAIGVGSGNVPAWVCADADPEAAAVAVVASKAFDHGIVCGSEDNLLVDEAVRAPFVAALRRAGAAVLDGQQTDRLAAHAFDPADGHLRRSVLGQPASQIAAAAGVELDDPVRVLVLPCRWSRSTGPMAGRSWPAGVAVHRGGSGAGSVGMPAAARQPGSGAHRRDPHQRPAAPATLRRGDPGQPHPGQQPRHPRLPRHRQRPGAVADSGLWDLRRQLHHRHRHLHQPAQRQAAPTPPPSGSRTVLRCVTTVAPICPTRLEPGSWTR